MPRAAQATRRLSHIQCSLGGDAGGASHYIPAYPGISRHISDPFFCSRAPGWRARRLAAQQTQHRLALAPGRKPSPTAVPGSISGRPPGSLRRRRTLIWLPHFDTPPASTLSQSSVQGNPGAQEVAHRHRHATEACRDVWRRLWPSSSRCGHAWRTTGATSERHQSITRLISRRSTVSNCDPWARQKATFNHGLLGLGIRGSKDH